MEKAIYNGQMDHLIKDNLVKIKYMGMVNFYGKMAILIKDIG